MVGWFNIAKRGVNHVMNGKQVELKDMDEDERARMAEWFNIAKRVVGGINHAVNEKLAGQQKTTMTSKLNWLDGLI